MPSPTLALGVDVQISRGLAWVALNHERSLVDAGWIDTPKDDLNAPAHALTRLALSLQDAHSCPVHTALDAPRCPIQTPRAYAWDGKRNHWRPRTPKERGFGRHSEVAVSALKLARPQWTPPRTDAPDWMLLGFNLFEHLNQALIPTYEAFPSAAYTQLSRDATAPTLPIPTHCAARGPKDILDATIAAYTLLCVRSGEGCEVGGGDGLGTIILPRKEAGYCASNLSKYPQYVAVHQRDLKYS